MEIKIDTTFERDIDLLILEEFVSNPLFAKIFFGENCSLHHMWIFVR